MRKKLRLYLLDFVVMGSNRRTDEGDCGESLTAEEIVKQVKFLFVKKEIGA